MTRLPNPFGQPLFLQGEPQFVLTGGSQIPKSLVQPKYKRRRRQSAHRHRGIPLFQPPERVPAYEQPLGHIFRGYPPLSPSDGQVSPKFPERIGRR